MSSFMREMISMHIKNTSSEDDKVIEDRLKDLNTKAALRLGTKLRAVDIPAQLPDGWHSDDLCYFVALHMYIDRMLRPRSKDQSDDENGIDFIANVKVAYEDVRYIHFFGNAGYSDQAHDEVHIKTAAGMIYPPVRQEYVNQDMLSLSIRSHHEEFDHLIKELCEGGDIYRYQDNGLVPKSGTFSYKGLTPTYSYRSYSDEENEFEFSKFLSNYQLDEFVQEGKVNEEDYAYLKDYFQRAYDMYPSQYSLSHDGNWLSIWLLLPYTQGTKYDQYNGTDKTVHMFSYDIQMRQLIIDQIDISDIKDSDTFGENYFDEEELSELGVIKIIENILND